MNRTEMIAFIKANPYVKITHCLFDAREYIYLADDGCVYDENGYLFEDWDFCSAAHNGLRMRKGGLWENGWSLYSESSDNKNEELSMKPEYLNARCCMCPNFQKNDIVCPGIPGTSHSHISSCRFVKAYIDERGWKYKVMSGIGGNSFKARYQKTEKQGMDGWKGLASVPWRETFDEAQADLNAYAKTKGWAEWV